MRCFSVQVAGTSATEVMLTSFKDVVMLIELLNVSRAYFLFRTAFMADFIDSS